MSKKVKNPTATPGFDPVRRKFLSTMAAAAGVTLARTATTVTGDALAGQTFVLTGSLTSPPGLAIINSDV